MYAIKRFLISLFVFSVFTIYGNSAFAEEDFNNTTKQFGDWMVVKSGAGVNEFCFAYTSPFRTKGFTGEYRKPPYMILSNKGRGEVSLGVNSGFIIDAQKGFTITVNERAHLLDVKLNENAWTYSSFQDTAILDDMIEDARFVEARSYDNKDHIAVDYYSLNGFIYAFKHLSTNCVGIQKSSE